MTVKLSSHRRPTQLLALLYLLILRHELTRFIRSI